VESRGRGREKYPSIQDILIPNVWRKWTLRFCTGEMNILAQSEDF
jgi:hypothetical protein